MKTFWTLITLASADVVAVRPEDPHFKPVESHFLTFPVNSDDFTRWQAMGDAVILSKKVIIAPECAGSSGYL
jgi:hypothetical protein